jgi:hypothetical protein
MPLNGKSTPVVKPSWLNEAPNASTTTSVQPRPSWSRKTVEPKKDEPAKDKSESPAKVIISKGMGKKETEPAKKEPEPVKKEVTAKLQSREIKVPQKVEKTVAPVSILKKPDVKIKQDLAEEKKTINLRDSKTPSKSPSKTPTTASSKSSSTRTTPSTTPSRSVSKTPDFDSDEEEEEEEEESSYESETDSSEETDSDIDSDEKPSYKPPSPGALRKHLIIPPLKKVTPDPSTSPERSTSPEHTFKKPELRKVITRQKSDAKERSTSPEPKFVKPKLRKVPSTIRVKDPPLREKLPVVELKKAPPKVEPEKSPRKMSEQFPHKPSILRAESNKKSEFNIEGKTAERADFSS